MPLVAELKDQELDYWVARANNDIIHTATLADFDLFRTSRLFAPVVELDVGETEDFDPIHRYEYAPSKHWGQAGEIIRQHRISIGWCYGSSVWKADCPKYNALGEWVGRVQQFSNNDDPLEAAMRCFVASKFGDHVEV